MTQEEDFEKLPLDEKERWHEKHSGEKKRRGVKLKIFLYWLSLPV